MTSRIRTLLAVAVALSSAIGAMVAAPPAGAAERGKVLIVSLPRLTWSTVRAQQPANLMGFIAESAVASMSLRTLGPTTSAGEAYATIGAGNRSGAAEDIAGLAFDADDAFELGTAAEALQRRTGARAGDDAVVHLGAAEIRGWNGRLLYGAEPGSLGSAVRRTAVVANADAPQFSGGVVAHREAALAMMGSGGVVPAGTVSGILNRTDADAPFGIRADAAVVIDEARKAWAGADVLLVEASDLERAELFNEYATPEQRRRHQRDAVRRADRILGALLDMVDADDLVMVLSPTSPRSDEQLTVAAIRGPGFEPGLARSATTRRVGYVSLSDVAPTIVDFTGVEAPEAMTGTIMTSAGGGPPTDADLANLVRVNEMATFRDDATGPVSVVFIILQVLVYGLCALALRRGRRFAGPVAALALAVLAVPPLAFLSGLVRYDTLGLAPYLVVLFAGAIVLGALVARLTGGHPTLGPALLTGFTLGLLLVDVLTGGWLQINTVFGYSPIVAGRFAGYGNLAFALVAMSTIVFTTSMWAVLAGRALSARAQLTAVAVLLALVIVVVGSPAWGSDVGGVLASVPAFLAVLVVLSGRTVRGRLLPIGLSGVAAVSVFAAIDLARPASARTHLGRFADRLLDDPTNVFEILQRKLQTNISILTSSIWTLAIPIALVFLLFVTWRGAPRLQRVEESVPGLRATLVAGLVAGLLGFALNDSGVAVPAMMLAVLLPYLSYLLLRVPERDLAP